MTLKNKYCQVSNINRTSVGNQIVCHSDVVGASPVGAAPTTSSFSTWHLASKYCAKTTGRRDDKHLIFGSGASYIRDFTALGVITDPTPPSAFQSYHIEHLMAAFIKKIHCLFDSRLFICSHHLQAALVASVVRASCKLPCGSENLHDEGSLMRVKALSRRNQSKIIPRLDIFIV